MDVMCLSAVGCVYVSLYYVAVCMHFCMYAYQYACMYKYVCTYIHMYACMYACMYLSRYVSVGYLSWLELGVSELGDRGTNPGHCNNI